MKQYSKNILITGGAGFIGSHVIRLFVQKYPNYRVVNLDKLTYAGNLDNVSDISEAENYTFVQADIADGNKVKQVFEDYNITDVIHLAAESHVDRSIEHPLSFVTTNLVGTSQLLLIAKNYWKDDYSKHLFYHVSTDEVYGSLEMNDDLFKETTPYDPRSPYSASKAGSDHMVRAFYHTYNIPVVISNCSNNYGPNQYPEKLIPLFIKNIMDRKPLPIYGDGVNVRDWLYVEDHAKAIDVIFHTGIHGETYNIGGNNELKNIDLVELLILNVDEELGNDIGFSKDLITFVPDRAGHDLRYAIDNTKIKEELGWEPEHTFEEGIVETVKWYVKEFNID